DGARGALGRDADPHRRPLRCESENPHRRQPPRTSGAAPGRPAHRGPECADGGEREARAADRRRACQRRRALRAGGPRRVPTRFYMAEPGLENTIEFAWPVEGQVVSPFGRRRLGWHAGMDIKAEIGAPILAAAPGTVISSGQERAYG